MKSQGKWVSNSDNINISGESFDYGPWRFLAEYDPAFTAAYFDHHGLYAFGRQPEAIQWNLAQFAGCLVHLADAAPLNDGLQAWGEAFHRELATALVARLGIAAADHADADRVLARLLLAALGRQDVAIDRLFFDWRGGRDPGGAHFAAPEYRALAEALVGRGRAASHPYWSDPAPCSLLIDEVEAIWAAIAERDDWTPFEAKVVAIRRVGEAMLSH